MGPSPIAWPAASTNNQAEPSKDAQRTSGTKAAEAFLRATPRGNDEGSASADARHRAPDAWAAPAPTVPAPNVTTVNFKRTAAPAFLASDAPSAPGRAAAPATTHVPFKIIETAPRPSRAAKSVLRLPVLLSLLAAVVIIGAAILLRPETPAPRVADPAPAAESDESDAASPALDVPTDAAPASTPEPATSEPDVAKPAPEAAAPEPAATDTATPVPEPQTDPQPAEITPPAPLIDTPEADTAPQTSPPEDAMPPGNGRPMPRPETVTGASIVPAPSRADEATVIIRFGPDLSEKRHNAIVAKLADAGYATVLVEPVGFNVARSRLGFFRSADRDMAEALVKVLGPLTGTVAVRNYDELIAEPAPGRLDLWLSS